MPLILAVLCVVYIGMALGRWPGLRMDRTGIAILGAVVLYAGGAVDSRDALQAIDFPTLIVLVQVEDVRAAIVRLRAVELTGAAG